MNGPVWGEMDTRTEVQHKAVGVVRHSTSGREDLKKTWSGSNVGSEGSEVTS